MQRAAILAAGAAMVLTVAGPAAAAPSSGTATPGAQLWVKHHPDNMSRGPNATYAAVGPQGGRVFVTGPDGTVAYNAVTGAQLWVHPGINIEFPQSAAVSPSGNAVFITGAGGNSSYATIAYNAATGAQLWASFYQGGDIGASVAVSPSGDAVFVAGTNGPVAYDAATGAQLWASPGTDSEFPRSLAVSPDGSRVFVTGSATAAYDAATGAQLWSRAAGARAVAVSPGGGRVFVTGGAITTVAYRAATGARLWATQYKSPPSKGEDFGAGVAVSPAGEVFVTGSSAGRTSHQDYATIGYRAATGARLWVRRYNGPGNADDIARSVAVSPSGGTVYVTGSSGGATSGWDYATIAYRAATGAWRWTRRYNGRGNADDIASCVAVGPKGRAVFVTGEGFGRRFYMEYATIAYRA